MCRATSPLGDCSVSSFPELSAPASLRSALRLSSHKSFMNSSGLFKARSSILSPREAGPHPSWCGNDVADDFSGSLHSWSRLHDLCALQAVLRRPPQPYRPPRRRTAESRSGRSRRSDLRPGREIRPAQLGPAPIRRLAHPQRPIQKAFRKQRFPPPAHIGPTPTALTCMGP
jgi:hypothetical protein